MFRLFWTLARLARTILGWAAGLPRRAAIGLGAPDSSGAARPERLWRGIAITVPVALASAWMLPQLTLVMSPSIDAWVVRAASGPIRKGDLVQFSLSHPVVGAKPVSATKYALCMPGERLTRIKTPSTRGAAWDSHYFCNGALLGVSLPYARDGSRLSHLNWSGIIPRGMVYVGSHHPRGFDSRYIGLVPISRLRRMQRLF